MVIWSNNTNGRFQLIMTKIIEIMNNIMIDGKIILLVNDHKTKNKILITYIVLT